MQRGRENPLSLHVLEVFRRLGQPKFLTAMARRMNVALVVFTLLLCVQSVKVSFASSPTREGERIHLMVFWLVGNFTLRSPLITPNFLSLHISRMVYCSCAIYTCMLLKFFVHFKVIASFCMPRVANAKHKTSVEAGARGQHE